MMQNNLQKKMLIWSVIFFVFAMSVMLYYSATKTIVIARDPLAETVRQTSAGDFSGWRERKVSSLLFGEQKDTGKELVIPMPEQIRPDDVTLENQFAHHQLLVSLRGKYSDFYQTHSITGNYQHVESGYYTDEGEATRLIFQLDSLLDYQYVYENHQLKLTFQKAGDLYEKIVVIDPAGDGTSGNGVLEDKLTLKLSEQIREYMADSGIQLFFTRSDDRVQEEEKCLQMIRDLNADMVVRIQVEADEQSKVYGMQSYFNGLYVIPGFGNVELADLLVKETAQSSGAKANGLFAAGKGDALLADLEVPAAAISVGYLSNEAEADLLSQKEYQDKVARGIAVAIEKAFAALEENKKITIGLE